MDSTPLGRCNRAQAQSFPTLEAQHGAPRSSQPDGDIMVGMHKRWVRVMLLNANTMAFSEWCLMTRRSLDPLNAEGDQTVSPAGSLKLFRLQAELGARHPERMTEGNGAAIGVDAGIVSKSPTPDVQAVATPRSTR